MAKFTLEIDNGDTEEVFKYDDYSSALAAWKIAEQKVKSKQFYSARVRDAGGKSRLWVEQAAFYEDED